MDNEWVITQWPRRQGHTRPGNPGPGVEVTHIPSGLSMHCAKFRSQHQNKNHCIKRITAALETGTDLEGYPILKEVVWRVGEAPQKEVVVSKTVQELGTSRFLQALLGRYGPLLDPQQVAALRDTTVEKLDYWVNELFPDGGELADFSVWLMDMNQNMRSYLACRRSANTPALAEWLALQLQINRRKYPLGTVIAMPKSKARRAATGEEAGSILLGLAGKPGPR